MYPINARDQLLRLVDEGNVGIGSICHKFSEFGAGTYLLGSAKDDQILLEKGTPLLDRVLRHVGERRVQEPVGPFYACKTIIM